MAVSRVGGSKGLLRGQVGDVIYQVVKNPDGTYSQTVYGKKDKTTETITPRLQAQRMCMAMVESLMHDLKEIGRISFQSGRTKSNSLNAFSANNVRMVQRDCQAHWYEQNRFVFPRRYSTIKDIQDLGGPYIISSGTLSYDLFDCIEFDNFPRSNWQGLPNDNYYLYGLRFSCQIGRESVSAFLARHRMSILDTVAFCGFRSWIDWGDGEVEPTEYMKHEYFIAKINNRVPSSAIMTLDVIKELFTIKYSWEPVFLASRDNDAFVIAFLCDYQEHEEQLYYDAGFSISYPNGRKQISTSFYKTPDGSDEPWYIDQAPCHVFGSWMGEPTIDPYPSPFE